MTYPSHAIGWYAVCFSQKLAKPQEITIAGKRVVAFRTSSGTPVIMDNACSHMGASLAQLDRRVHRFYPA